MHRYYRIDGLRNIMFTLGIRRYRQRRQVAAMALPYVIRFEGRYAAAEGYALRLLADVYARYAARHRRTASQMTGITR